MLDEANLAITASSFTGAGKTKQGSTVSAENLTAIKEGKKYASRMWVTQAQGGGQYKNSNSEVEISFADSSNPNTNDGDGDGDGDGENDQAKMLMVSLGAASALVLNAILF